MTQGTPELTIGAGSALMPAEDFNAYAQGVIEAEGAKALGECVAKLVYERGFATTTGLSVQEVVDGRGYIQMQFFVRCSAFADSIEPPLTPEERESFGAGLLELRKPQVAP